jgi:hypothetical protein
MARAASSAVRPFGSMTDAGWWARVVQARAEREDLLPKRVWALRKGERMAAIDVRPVPGIGARSCSPSRRVAALAAVPLLRAGGTGRDCGHAGAVRGEGVDVTPALTPKPMECGGCTGRRWTEMLKKSPGACARVQLPTVRNQQVVASKGRPDSLVPSRFRPRIRGNSRIHGLARTSVGAAHSTCLAARRQAHFAGAPEWVSRLATECLAAPKLFEAAEW